MSLTKTRLSLMKNALKSLAKGVLVLLGLTTAASKTDAAIHRKMFGSGHPRMLASRPSDLASRITALIILNEELKEFKSLEKSGLLIKGVSKTIKNELKEQKGSFLSML